MKKYFIYTFFALLSCISSYLLTMDQDEIPVISFENIQQSVSTEIKTLIKDAAYYIYEECNYIDSVMQKTHTPIYKKRWLVSFYPNTNTNKSQKIYICFKDEKLPKWTKKHKDYCDNLLLDQKDRLKPEEVLIEEHFPSGQPFLKLYKNGLLINTQSIYYQHEGHNLYQPNKDCQIGNVHFMDIKNPYHFLTKYTGPSDFYSNVKKVTYYNAFYIQAIGTYDNNGILTVSSTWQHKSVQASALCCVGLLVWCITKRLLK